MVRRAGFALTRPQARQGVVHGHFLVNGVRTNKPSYQVRAGDVITVRRRNNLLKMYQGTCSLAIGEPCDWLAADTETLRITVAGNPGASDISLPVDGNTVVEFMSR